MPGSHVCYCNLPSFTARTASVPFAHEEKRSGPIVRNGLLVLPSHLTWGSRRDRGGPERERPQHGGLEDAESIEQTRLLSRANTP